MRTPLALLLPSLALSSGCPLQSTGSCDDFEGGTFDRDAEFSVTVAELEAVLDDDGNLSEAGCHELCRANHWAEDNIVDIKSCDVAMYEYATGAPFAPDTSDTGATPHTVTCSWTENAVCEGRAHAAVATHPQGSGPTELAAWLARAAHAEAASVKAFVALGCELDDHGAPFALVARCTQAAKEEIEHARRMGALAALHGGRPTKPRMGATPERSLLDLAIENVVEGCVRETWSAMVAHWQAHHAEDPGVRAVMHDIAHDEANHGDLAHAIHAWAMARLDDDGRRSVLAARDRAVAGLLEHLDQDVSESLVRKAGLPTRTNALRLARMLAGHRWSVPLAA